MGRRGLQHLAQDHAAVVGVGPLPVFDEAVAAAHVEVHEVLVGLGHAEAQFFGFVFAGAAFDGAQEHLADAAALVVGIDGELAEPGDVGAMEPRRAFGFFDFVVEDDADEFLLRDGEDAVGVFGVGHGDVFDGDPGFATEDALLGLGVGLAAGEGGEAHGDLLGVCAVQELGDFRDGVGGAEAAHGDVGRGTLGSGVGRGSGRGWVRRLLLAGVGLRLVVRHRGKCSLCSCQFANPVGVCVRVRSARRG